MRAVDDPRWFTPADRVLLAYLVATLPLFLLLGDHPTALSSTIFFHAGGIAAIVLARRSGLAGTAWGRVVLDFYPIVAFSLLYSEAAVLNRAFHPDGFLDRTILSAEAFLFGGQPSQTWRAAAPWPPLAEYLHFAYFSYYLCIPLLPITMRVAGGREALHRVLGMMALAFTAGFVLFILIPVRGPFHEFIPADPEELGYFFPKVVHGILHRGSSFGTAFPSSHCSVGFTVWFLAMRYHKPLALLLAFFIPAMAIGTVYGGFHYLVDVLAGIALAGVVVVFGRPLVYRWLDGPTARLRGAAGPERNSLFK